MELKGTLGIHVVIMSDKVPARFVAFRLWHYDEPALYIVQSQNYNNNKLSVLLEPHSSFLLQYRLLKMTTFFEIAVYFY